MALFEPLFKSLFEPLFVRQFAPAAGNGEAALYDFSRTPISEAVKEVYRNGQSEAVQYNDTERNIVQSDGSVETFPANAVAFVEGEGVVNLDEATNYMPNADMVDLTAWIKRGTGTIVSSSEPAPFGDGLTMALVTVNNVGEGGNPNNDVFMSASSLTASAPVAAGVFIKAVTTGKILVQNPTGIGGQWRVDLSLVEGIQYVTRDHSSVEGILSDWTASGTGNGGFLFQPAPAQGEQQFYIFAPQQQDNGNYIPSSPVLTNSASPATRLKDNTQISTFLEKGVWQDDQRVSTLPFMVGEFNLEGVYENGINKIDSTRFNMVTSANGGGQASKYLNLLTAEWVDALFTVGDYVFMCSTFGNINRITCEMVSGDIDECIALLRSFEPIKADFTPSDYWTGDFTSDTAAVSALRTAAGDDVSAIPAAELWRGENFAISTVLRLLDLPENNTYLLANQDSPTDNRFLVYVDSGKQLRALVRDSGGTTYVTPPILTLTGNEVLDITASIANDTLKLTCNGLSAQQALLAGTKVNWIDGRLRVGWHPNNSHAVDLICSRFRYQKL